MPRTEGPYWVRERADGTPIVARYRKRKWMFGDGADLRDESGLDVIGGPLLPPEGGRPADWQARYDRTIKALKAAGEKDPLFGWDFLPGYYWVAVSGQAEPVLAQYLEGWFQAAEGTGYEDDDVQIIEGPLTPPVVTKRVSA